MGRMLGIGGMLRMKNAVVVIPDILSIPGILVSFD
jgi:hypothetical protein